MLPRYSSPLLARGRRELLPTKGKRVCRWIEAYCVYGEGDWYGQPVQLREWQRRFIERLYEYWPESGERRYKRALLGMGKGNGKTPLAAWVGAYELAGGTTVSPRVIIGAASLKQANLVFGDLRTTMKEGPLSPFVEPYELQILLKDQPGVAERIAAEAGTNDGARATAFIADEVHEWTGRTKRVYLVVNGAVAKRKDAFTLAISTAGVMGEDSVCEELYSYGKQVASGEITDDAFLFEWYEAAEGLNLDDEAEWLEAVMAANPAAGDFNSIENIRHRFHTMPLFEFCRYHLNQHTAAEFHWLPPGAWESGVKPRRGEKARLVLAFCGTYDGDAAALAAATEDGYVFTLNAWESDLANYQVPRAEVEAEIARAMKRYPGSTLVADPLGWHSETQAWSETYGERKVIEFDWQHQIKRKADACSKFYTAVVAGTLKHDADPVMARHLDAAVVKDHKEGSYIGRGSREGPYVGLAQCAVMAFEVATLPKRRSAYSEHGLMTV